MAARVVMPSFGMYTAEGSVAAWLVPPGSAVEAGQSIVEITTDKASYEIEAPASGTFQPVAELNASLQVEGLIALVLEPGESFDVALAAASAAAGVAAEAPAENAPTAPPTPEAPRVEREAGPRGGGHQPASPLARRLARELGVELEGVVGTGPGGRIVEADVRAAAERRSGAS